jgi:hypothetical protein
MDEPAMKLSELSPGDSGLVRVERVGSHDGTYTKFRLIGSNANLVVFTIDAKKVVVADVLSAPQPGQVWSSKSLGLTTQVVYSDETSVMLENHPVHTSPSGDRHRWVVTVSELRQFYRKIS